MAAFTTNVSAQQIFDPGPLPGKFNELQRPVADGILKVCANLVGTLGIQPNPDGTPVQRLALSCSKMVSTATAGAPPGAGFLDLKLSEGQLATAIQALAPVQANAQKQIGTESVKMNAIGARMLSLRGGARGLVLGMNGQSVTGGGAAADDVLGGKTGGFINVSYNWGTIDKTTLQDGYKQHSYNILAGADYRTSDSFVVGGAISYSDTSAKYELGLGRVEAKTTGAIGYATYYRDDWYVDGLVSYSDVDYDSRRNINIPSNNTAVVPGIFTVATSSPKGDQWSAALGMGKDIRSDSYTITPSARLNYIHVRNKAFSESEPVAGLGLVVNARTIESLQSALGAKIGTTVNTSSAVLAPYFSAQWMHEFKDGSPALTSRYVNDPNGIRFTIATANPTRNFAILAIGTSMTMPNYVSGFAQFSTAAGLKDETGYAVTAGLRMQF
ncbi:autotransporter outer membrane beta-barrel domain-containing protein [Pseudoduganella sp. OTU4001]|uniref:autotransporter outer membrane beta-barrel domain-containing protein n=1 Tax=Pseudoduganella sp. OTU4001 TaxID=3043854 RepID=UPI00313EE3BA